MFSVSAERLLTEADRIRPVAGTAEFIDATADKVQVQVSYEGREERLVFDYVIVATGFDALWWQELLTPRARAPLDRYAGGDGRLQSQRVEESIEHDLSLAAVAPNLHLPGLSGMAQGPGFPNLSCLGLLGDRVLGAYAEPSRGAPSTGRRPARFGAYHH